MADTKPKDRKPKKPAPEGVKRSAGKGRSWRFRLFIIAVILLAYAVSYVPVAVLVNGMAHGRTRETIESVAKVVYWPVEAVKSRVKAVDAAYAWGFKQFGLR